MKKTVFVFLIIRSIAGISFAKDQVKIGLITPLTGDVKTFGESTKNAFNVALEEYAKTGKYQIVPLAAGDRNDPTEGANAALKLITQEKVAAVVGPLTSKVAIPVSEIADKNKVPMVSGSATNEKVTVYESKRKPYVFRACYIDAFQCRVAANYALKDLKMKTAAVLYDVGNDYYYSKGLAEVFKATFEKGGGRIVAYESYQKDDIDFSALITKIGTKKPELIFIPDYYNKVALIARQVREKGLKSAMMGGNGWDSPELVKIGGNAIIGNYFTTITSPSAKTRWRRRSSRNIKERHGQVPDALAALGYDATMIVLQALDKAKKPTPEEIMKVLTLMKNFKGVTGTISFDKNGDAVKSVVVLKVDKDGSRYVSTVNP